ncbi:hypothetical protein BAE44_0000633 [Dichanthelium oligosanthes]|uniref:Short-chain type dehydrogenase/reductase n=1 Tax=Dichanthelium oligosanthes TaxID=888268 RepID=A0A1E5WLT8_9POAL|nr:hypothetical protein BAE44_0000633 [Dichanthelium oligosanthes]
MPRSAPAHGPGHLPVLPRGGQAAGLRRPRPTFSSSGVGSLRPGYSVYVASKAKAAVEVMTKILAREPRGTGIVTANVVAPGSTGTPMFYTGKTADERGGAERYVAEALLGRLGMPEDIAPLVGFLASDAGHWVKAQVLRCNGGTI